MLDRSHISRVGGGRALLGAGILLLVVLTACQTDVTETALGPAGPTGPADGASFVVGDDGDGQVDGEEFEVCKEGSGASFQVSVGGVVVGGTSLADGRCEIVYLSGGIGATVTVTETAADAGFQLDSIRVTRLTNGTTVTHQTIIGSSSAEGAVSGSPGPTGISGVLAIFYNGPIPPPPPGGEGCTPAYWKQPHHFDSWPDGFAPTGPGATLFEDLFSAADGFSGLDDITLLAALTLKGNRNGFEALARHAAAAVLNAASPDVSYDLTVAQIQTLVNGALTDGSKSAMRAAKNTLETLNQQGCPLN